MAVSSTLAREKVGRLLGWCSSLLLPGSPVTHITKPRLLCLPNATQHHDGPGFPVIGCVPRCLCWHRSLLHVLKAETGTQWSHSFSKISVRQVIWDSTTFTHGICPRHLRHLWHLSMSSTYYLCLSPLLGYRLPTTAFQHPCPGLFSEAASMCSPPCWCLLQVVAARCFLVNHGFQESTCLVM